MSTSPGYEARYGFPPAYARLLFVCTAFAVGSLLLRLSTALRLVEVLVFVTADVVLLALGLRKIRQVALRVDETGLTLGSERMPWTEVRGVRLTRDAVTAVRRGNREQVSAPVQGWRLDAGRFTEAAKEYAPKVVVTTG